MSFLDFFRQPDIHQGVGEYQSTPGAVLLDVRSAEEYQRGRIPGSHHLPVQEVQNVSTVVPQKDAAVFVYCHSGVRSGQAVKIMKQLGYTNVNNIGGIAAYRVPIEK